MNDEPYEPCDDDDDDQSVEIHSHRASSAPVNQVSLLVTSIVLFVILVKLLSCLLYVFCRLMRPCVSNCVVMTDSGFALNVSRVVYHIYQ